MHDHIDEIARKLATALQKPDRARTNGAPHSPDSEDERRRAIIVAVLQAEFPRFAFKGNMEQVAQRLLAVLHEVEMGPIRPILTDDSDQAARLHLLSEFLRDQLKRGEPQT